MAAGAMMKMGVRAKSVCAMPVAVYWVASSDALTPMNGPKMVVAANGTQISQKLADLNSAQICEFRGTLIRNNHHCAGISLTSFHVFEDFRVNSFETSFGKATKSYRRYQTFNPTLSRSSEFSTKYSNK